MTDPLTGKELVQKSYEYIEKLSRECTKNLLEDYSKSHKKFQLGAAPREVSSNVVQWFEKRDKNVRLAFDPNSVTRPQRTQVHMKFTGNTKDADFTLDGSLGLFVVPGTPVSDDAISFPKTLTISANKVSFAKRKA